MAVRGKKTSTAKSEQAPRARPPASKTKSGASTEELVIDKRFEPIVAAFRERDGVTLARMFSARGVLKRDGKLFAMVVRDELVVKLPKARVDALVAEARAVQFDPGHGRLMKEWASVAEGSLPWLPLAEEAFQFAGGSGAARATKRARKKTAPSER